MVPNLPTVRFEGRVVFRYSSYDTPFWARNNQSGGRWHVAERHATQYLSTAPDGAWAELVRQEGLRTEEDVALVRMQIWAATIDQSNLVDYSTFEQAVTAGFSPHSLVDDDWSACQAEGERLRELGYAGVVTPSAALAEAVNVTLFGPRTRATWGQSPHLASAIPACVVAVGSPPAGIVPRVRQYGDVHHGSRQYLEGQAEQARIRELHADGREEKSE